MCSNLYHLTIPFQLSNLCCHSNFCCLPSFPFLLLFHLSRNRTWPNDLTSHYCSKSSYTFHFCLSLYLSANRTTHHLNFLMCRRRQCSNLVPIVMRAHGCSDLSNCPTLRVTLTWCSCWNCQDLVPVFVPVQCFQHPLDPLVQCRMCCVVSDESKELIFQVVRLNFVYVDLCVHRSAVGLWDHSLVGRFDDGAGHRFFWRLSSKLSEQLPDHVQQVKRLCKLAGSLQFLELTGNGGCALHIPSVEPVGGSVPSFSCNLGAVHILASDTCCKSLHRKVFVFVKLSDLFSSSCWASTMNLSLSHSCICAASLNIVSCAASLNIVSKSWSIRATHDGKPQKKKAPPQPTIVYNTVHNASSATISSSGAAACTDGLVHSTCEAWVAFLSPVLAPTNPNTPRPRNDLSVLPSSKARVKGRFHDWPRRS